MVKTCPKMVDLTPPGSGERAGTMAPRRSPSCRAARRGAAPPLGGPPCCSANLSAQIRCCGRRLTPGEFGLFTGYKCESV